MKVKPNAEIPVSFSLFPFKRRKTFKTVKISYGTSEDYITLTKFS